MAFPKVYTGSRAVVQINNEVVALAHVANWSIETRGSELETIDWVFPMEITPERVRVTMDLRVYRTPDNDPVLLEMTPGGNGSLKAEQYDFTQYRYVQIEIKDLNDQTIIYLPRAMVVRRSASLSHGDFMAENWSVVSIGYRGPN